MTFTDLQLKLTNKKAQNLYEITPLKRLQLKINE